MKPMKFSHTVHHVGWPNAWTKEKKDALDFLPNGGLLDFFME
jgi:hypothetical protein